MGGILPRSPEHSPLRDEVGLRHAVERLAERYGLAELYVFGSRAGEVAARVRGSTAPEGPDELEDLLGASRVDVVLLPTAGAFLALDVIRGELLYCADPDAQAEYELYVLRRAGDLAPFQRLRQEIALSRYIDR
jgi:uncharacterized protein